MNHFKKSVLDERENVVGKAQEKLLISKLRPENNPKISSERNDLPPDARSWCSWYLEGVTPKKTKIVLLDNLLNQLESPEKPSRFLEEMAFGGLVACMTHEFNAKNIEGALKARADTYKPVSPIHLLLDAIEIVLREMEFNNIFETQLRDVATKRIQFLLHEKWNPRTGSFYKKTFRSLDSVDFSQCSNSLDSHLNFKPSLSSLGLTLQHSPTWINVPKDIAPDHIHRILMSLSADKAFIFDNRALDWAMDMLTAILVLFSRAWMNRYSVFGRELSPEARDLAAFDAVFIEQEALHDGVSECEGRGNEYVDSVKFYLAPILSNLSLEEARCCADSFKLGRKTLDDFLTPLDLSVKELFGFTQDAWDKSPLVFKP